MPMYVYHAEGFPVGFRFGDYLHDMDGTALGRVLGTGVYRLDGSYVGEWFKDCAVQKPTHSPRRIHPARDPGKAPVPSGFTHIRRGVVDYGYSDVFHLLKTAEDELTLYHMAAE